MDIRAWLAALILVAPAGLVLAHDDHDSRRNCRASTDSSPSSLGADGWAAVDGAVTGGCGAPRSRVYHVRNRGQLVDALTREGHRGWHHHHGKHRKHGKHEVLDHRAKIIYVHGTIDLNVDRRNRPLVEEDYMRRCNYTDHETFYDPATGNQTGSGGFFGAYKAAYDPNLWIQQSLDPADNRPPALTGPLEEARLCFQQAQAEVVVIDVGSNTSIIGVGADARIINGGLRLGFINQNDVDDRDNYSAKNIVVRNVTFSDSFDMFSSWDPKDSFSITITNTGGCQAVYDAAADAGPHKCPTRRGGRWNTEYDNISVMNAERVWIDHNSFNDEPRSDAQFPPLFAAPFNEPTQKTQHHDGNVDVTLLGTKVTISNNYFLRHDKTNLLGGSDFANLANLPDRLPGYGPGKIDVTFHGNYYRDIVQRAPRVRFGKVHAYNNVFDVDRRTTQPGSVPTEYRLGDPWATGTAGKLYTENNLFEIRNNNLTIPRIINYASTLANRDLCVSEGYAVEDCGTYYGNTGTWVTMIAINSAGTVTGTSTTEMIGAFDLFTLLKTIQESSAANAPLMKLDPLDGAVYWLPSQSYPYTAMPVSTPDERTALRDNVVARAGAGKL
jgi:pectate lyase